MSRLSSIFNGPINIPRPINLNKPGEFVCGKNGRPYGAKIQFLSIKCPCILFMSNVMFSKKYKHFYVDWRDYSFWNLLSSLIKTNMFFHVWFQLIYIVQFCIRYGNWWQKIPQICLTVFITYNLLKANFMYIRSSQSVYFIDFYSLMLRLWKEILRICSIISSRSYKVSKFHKVWRNWTISSTLWLSKSLLR